MSDKALESQRILVVENSELSGAGNRVFDYQLDAWSQQLSIAQAYEVLAKAAEQIDDEDVSAFLASNR